MHKFDISESKIIEIQGASSLEKKSKIYFSVLDDVIHDRYFMTSYASITTPVTLTISVRYHVMKKITPEKPELS